jgi:hypothetical protein
MGSTHLITLVAWMHGKHRRAWEYAWRCTYITTHVIIILIKHGFWNWIPEFKYKDITAGVRRSITYNA